VNTEIVRLVLVFLAGTGLGCFYFGGLWLTVRFLPQSRRPVLISLGSFFGRTALAVLGFYLVMAGHWERLMVALLGFVLMREILTRRLGKKRGSSRSPQREAYRHGD
jgi:F1F0 ATPase subunit 2